MVEDSRSIWIRDIKGDATRTGQYIYPSSTLLKLQFR